MATKLENLDITSVDFVPRGANPKADIMITKNEKNDSLLDKLEKALAAILDKNHDAEPVEKDATTFSEMLTEQQVYSVLEEVRVTVYALTRSIESILTDTESSDKAFWMNQSLAEFNSAMQGYIQKWASGQLVGIAKSKVDAKSIMKTEEETKMDIDKSKLTTEEKDFLANIEAKAGVIIDANASVPAPAEKEVTKNDTSDILSRFDSIMKALDSTVTKIENYKLAAVAKKYEILGMKQEELIPFFKELKKDPAMYDSIIKHFDAAVAAVEASGVFEEIGKRGMEESSGNAVAKIAKFADEIMKKNPGVGRVKAEQMAWEQHPELVAEYEAQA